MLSPQKENIPKKIRKKLSLNKKTRSAVTQSSGFPGVYLSDEEDFVASSVSGSVARLIAGENKQPEELSLSQIIEKEVGHQPMPVSDSELGDLDFLTCNM